jgi:hypothetical protein
LKDYLSTKPGQLQFAPTPLLDAPSAPHESVPEFRECRLEDRFQHLQQRLLNEAAQHTGNAKLALALPSRFVDCDAPHQ